MAYLGVDWGESKIGVAVADDEGISVSPIEVIIRGRKTDIEIKALLIKLSVQWQVSKIVFGLPLGLNGEETPKCKQIKDFAQSLSLSVDYYPEYYSTKIGTQGLSRKQKQIMGDAYAAAHILEKYLEWKKE